MRKLHDILDMRERITYHLQNTNKGQTEVLVSINRALKWVLNELDNLDEVPSGDDAKLSELDD